MLIPRRRLLQLGLGLAAAAAVPTFPGCSGGAPPPLEPPIDPIIPPQVVEAELNLQMATTILDGVPFTHRSFNGMLGGPVLRVRPGDLLRVTFRNMLPPNPPRPADLDMNIPHDFNTSNLHMHGFHVSPEGNSDNIFLHVEPGETQVYEFAIPADHPTGTYFYHPHKHGSVTVQVFSGMAGMVIIEGGIDELPEIQAAREVLFRLNEVMQNDQGGVPDYTAKNAFRPAWRRMPVNGEMRPTFRIRPGEVQRWRVVNAGVAWTTPLRIEGHSQHSLALDGINFPQVVEVPSQVLAPGNRYDFLLVGGAPGTYRILKDPYQQANPLFGPIAMTPEVELATLIVEGEPVVMSLPTVLPTPASLPDITDDEITGKRTIDYATQFDKGGPSAAFPDNYTVDGFRFDANAPGQVVPLGAVEEWTVRSVVADTEHPFHIHINPFQVVAINGNPVPPRWQDTVILPMGGSVTLRTRFLDFTGRFVHHCHMLAHEDLGMMQNVEVVAPGARASVQDIREIGPRYVPPARLEADDWCGDP